MPEDGPEPRGETPAAVSLEEQLRRRDRLERDRMAATIMEPGLPEFHGPGAVAAAIAADEGAKLADAAATDGLGGTEAKKKALVSLADRYLWKTVWAWPTVLPSLAGLNLAAWVSKMEGWAAWKKVALIFLNLIVTLLVLGALTLLLIMMCLVMSECRSQILPFWADTLVGIGLWWVNL